MVYLIFPPIGLLLFSSVRDTQQRLPFEATTFTTANYVQVFSSAMTYKLLANTAWYAVGTVSLGLGLAILFAWFLERTNVPFRRLLFILMLAPIGVPGIIESMAWTLLANPANGLFNVALRSVLGLSSPGPLNIYSIPGMILVTAMRFVPVMYIMISGVFGRMDPSLEEAGRTSGAGATTTFRRISMPLLTPALLAAVIYYLVLAMEVFEIPAMLGRPKRIFVFSTAIYYAIRPLGTGALSNYGLAGTYGMVLLTVAGLLIYFYARYVRSANRFVTVTGRGYRPRLIDLGRWKFVPILAMSGYFILAVALPLLILLWTSLAPRYSEISVATLPLLSLDSYRKVLANPSIWVAAKNTLVIATTTGIVGIVLSTLASWLSVRSKIRGASIPERLAFLVMGVPGVVLGLAFILVYASMPLPIYGSIWIIVIALVTTSLPFGTRMMNAAFLQIHPELEEAASTSGVGLCSTLVHIDLPLLWASFTRGFVWIFSRSLRETTLTLMLYAVGNQTLSVTLWYLWVEDAKFDVASAIAVPLVIITSVLTFFVARQTMLQEGAA